MMMMVVVADDTLSCRLSSHKTIGKVRVLGNVSEHHVAAAQCALLWAAENGSRFGTDLKVG